MLVLFVEMLKARLAHEMTPSSSALYVFVSILVWLSDLLKKEIIPLVRSKVRHELDEEKMERHIGRASLSDRSRRSGAIERNLVETTYPTRSDLDKVHPPSTRAFLGPVLLCYCIELPR